MFYKVEYIYRGKKSEKVVEASNKHEAMSIVKSENTKFTIITVHEALAPIGKTLGDIKNKFYKLFNQKIKISEKIAFVRQVAVMTDAGIPIYDVLLEVASNTHNRTLNDILTQIANDINAGKSMSMALDRHKENMGHIVVAMTKLGEKTGNFPEAYNNLADILEQIRDNNNKFKKAMRYPITVVIALIFAFITVIISVVPKFRAIFAELGADLPIATKFLMSVESFFTNYGLYIIILIAILFFVHKRLYSSSNNYRYNIDKLLASPRFYLIGKLVYFSNIHNYTLVFGSLIKAGIPVSDALNTAVGVVGNRYINRQLKTINTNIGRGVSLSESFELTKLFENMTIQMLHAGESSGKLDYMLGKVTQYYKMKFQNLIDNLSAYIEPIMIAMIAGLVLLLALGIFMPMWDLGSAARA